MSQGKIEDLPARIVVSTRDNGSRRVVLHTSGDPRTLQGPSAESDVNNILAKYGASAFERPVAFTDDIRDFTQVGDYQTALNQSLEIESRFMSLPARLRARFGNDPVQLLEYIDNDDNYEDAVKLGILDPEKVNARKPKPEAPPTKVIVVDSSDTSKK